MVSQKKCAFGASMSQSKYSYEDFLAEREEMPVYDESILARELEALQNFSK